MAYGVRYHAEPHDADFNIFSCKNCDTLRESLLHSYYIPGREDTMTKEGTASAPYPTHRAVVDLNNTVLKVLQSRGDVHAAANIAIKLDLAESLPNVWADPNEINSVLLRLIANAEQAVDSDLGR